jgi:hypothetical protein
MCAKKQVNRYILNLQKCGSAPFTCVEPKLVDPFKKMHCNKIHYFLGVITTTFLVLVELPRSIKSKKLTDD